MRWIKTDCPSCGGNDYAITPENGMGFCFHCGYTSFESNHTQPVLTRGPVHEIRKFYTYLAMKAHENLSGEHEQYLLSRGITREQIQQEQIGFMPHIAPKTNIAVKAGIVSNGVNILADRFIFPYWIDQTVAELRGRSLTDELRYKNPFGSPYYRGADIYYHEHNSHEDHILTEGEIKTLVAERYGFLCVGMPGIQRHSTAYSNKKKVYIILDHESNPRTRSIIKHTIKRIAAKLIRVYVVMLPLRKGQKKAELDTYLLEHGATSLHILLESAMDIEQWSTHYV
jgi:hypothetical protein